MKILRISRIVLLWLVSCSVFASAAEVIRIASDEQLFLDEECIIEKTKNITYRINPALKYGSPVLAPNKPWEDATTLFFGSAMFDPEEKMYKMWYYSDGANFAYATSNDGIHWDKPELGIHFHDGQSTNVILKHKEWDYNYEIIGVLKDNRDPDPSRRYKMGYVTLQKPYKGPNESKYRPGCRAAFGTAYSPDGIHFKQGNLFATEEVCDISHFFYDPEKEEFVLHGRCKLSNKMLGTRFKKNGWGRGVVHLTSKDFDTWSPSEFVYAAERTDPYDAEVYSISSFPYSNLQIGMVQMYYHVSGRLDYQIAYSHDGKDIVRLEPRTPFLPEGEIGSWDRFNISLGNLPPLLVGDEWWFYYGGRTYRHPPYEGDDTRPKDAPYPRAQIGLAKVKRGRLYSLESSFEGGYVTTRPFRFEGTRLHINANAQYGKLAVGIRDENDQTFKNAVASFAGINSVDIPVTFEQFDVSSLRGKIVKLRIELENAQLYGFSIK